ncbi:hypothetical protein HRW23_35255 [Streptomyces lunaelactis]|uniref:hypothetical protein n=1 Tax=Streptomyces lunaelactis TaxID=1535768 RepID=UPI001584C7F1|nr:hypothetical protein [Streptomyces lunaelactis]NUK74106.1 hypothetical protein [Streptomyces lunaelactis]NUK82514.1 hypothetical protein [Streptomyces lunaelactis]
MTTWIQAALGCSIVAAALLIRTALGEIRRPGTARRQWRFLTNRAAAVAGIAAAISLGAAVAVGGRDPGHAVWALLGGVLTAFIVDRLMDT